MLILNSIYKMDTLNNMKGHIIKNRETLKWCLDHSLSICNICILISHEVPDVLNN